MYDRAERNEVFVCHENSENRTIFNQIVKSTQFKIESKQKMNGWNQLTNTNWLEASIESDSIIFVGLLCIEQAYIRSQWWIAPRHAAMPFNQNTQAPASGVWAFNIVQSTHCVWWRVCNLYSILKLKHPLNRKFCVHVRVWIYIQKSKNLQLFLTMVKAVYVNWTAACESWECRWQNSSVKSFGSLLLVQFQCKLHIQLTTKQETISEHILCALSGSIQRYPWHEIEVYTLYTRIKKIRNNAQWKANLLYLCRTIYIINSIRFQRSKNMVEFFQHFAKRPTQPNVQTFLHYSADSYWNLH